MENVTVYLHIGMFKTGSSALQYFLLNNRDILLRKGIAYPTHLIDPNGISSGNAKEIRLALQDNDVQKAKQVITDAMDSNCSTIILSSEFLYKLQKKHIAVLQKLLLPATTKIIVYLRRQDSLLLSDYHQGIKRSKRTVQMAPFIETVIANDRYLFEEVKTWASVWGKENMSIRPYEKQQFTGGNIFTDFLSAVGITDTSDFEFPAKRINKAYRIDALEFMRLLNFLELSIDKFVIDRLLQAYSETNSCTDDWPYPLTCPKELRKIAEKFNETNTIIARDYLGRADGALFYDPLPDTNEPWATYPGLTKKQIQEIASYIMKQDYKVAKCLSQAITEGLKSNDDQVQAAAKTLAPGLDFFWPKHRIFVMPKRYFEYRLQRIRQKISKKIR